MSACEKCWGDAFMREMSEPTKIQAEHYADLVQERRENPCSPREQAGQWWCEMCMTDSRNEWHSKHTIPREPSVVPVTEGEDR
jgi:hypothetical protein